MTFGKFPIRAVASLTEIEIRGTIIKKLARIKANKTSVTAQTLGINFSSLLIIGLIAQVITNEANSIIKISKEKIERVIIANMTIKTMTFLGLKTFVFSIFSPNFKIYLFMV